MTRRSILVLSASAGTGHTRAAEALCADALAAHAQLDVRHLDALQLVSPLLRILYTRAYAVMVKRAPALWRWLYHASHGLRDSGAVQRLLSSLQRRHARGLADAVQRLQPAVIVCTHFLPVEILAWHRAAGSLAMPLWVQVTDFDLHHSWVHGHVTGYFAPNDEVAFRLRERGVPAERIFSTGIPIMPAFAPAPARATCARALGLSPDRFTVLLLCGGRDIGSVNAIAAALLASRPDLQVVALGGRAPRALDALRRLQERFPGRLAASGYTSTIERLMACADVVVSKPGGLTTAETLAIGVPMIVIAPIPGQEEHNANYLLEHGAALRAFDLPTLLFRVGELAGHPRRHAAMRAAALALARPDAGRRALGLALAGSPHFTARMEAL